MHKETSWQLAAPQFLELAKFQIRIYVKRIGCKHLIAVKNVPKGWIWNDVSMDQIFERKGTFVFQPWCQPSSAELHWVTSLQLWRASNNLHVHKITKQSPYRWWCCHHSWSKWFWPLSTFVQLEEELVRQRVARKWYLVVIGDCPT